MSRVYLLGARPQIYAVFQLPQQLFPKGVDHPRNLSKDCFFSDCFRFTVFSPLTKGANGDYVLSISSDQTLYSE